MNVKVFETLSRNGLASCCSTSLEPAQHRAFEPWLAKVRLWRLWRLKWVVVAEAQV